jgi:hypothetical protein
MSADPVEHLTEAEAWCSGCSIPTRKREKKLEVCFTGTRASEKKDPASTAEEGNLNVVGSVTKNLGVLFRDPNTGLNTFGMSS